MPGVRSIALVFGATLALLAGGQAERKPQLFAQVRSDIVIVVREHESGANLVDISLLKEDYPANLLRGQIDELGRLVGSKPRGVNIYLYQIDPDKPKLTFLKASFGIDGLTDSRKHVLSIEPILKAFAGAPEANRITGISLVFEGQKATDSTVRNLETTAVLAEARINERPPALEYRILLRSQDATQITFPSGPPKLAPKQPPSETSGKSADIPPYTWFALGAAGIAAGALVYLALLRSRRLKG